jgi:hypothetical protein
VVSDDPLTGYATILLAAPTALATVTAAIAFAAFAALLFIEAGAPQAVAIRLSTAALLAIPATITFASFAALVPVHTGASQAFTTVTSPLHLFHNVIELAKAKCVRRPDRRGQDGLNAGKAQASC